MRIGVGSLSLLLIVALGGAALTGCGSSSSAAHSETVAQADFDGTWPFRVSTGTLRCVPGKEHPPLGAVVFKAGGTSYAVNGAARDSGYRRAGPIRNRAHSRLGDMIHEGTSLCPPNVGP